jgi:hypothetical protein
MSLLCKRSYSSEVWYKYAKNVVTWVRQAPVLVVTLYQCDIIFRFLEERRPHIQGSINAESWRWGYYLASKSRNTVSAVFQNKVILNYNVAEALKIAHNVINLKSPVLKMLTAIAQSAKRLATGWTVCRGLNSGGGNIFRTRPDRPCGPPTLLCNGYRVFPGSKTIGGGVDPPPPI